ncbi:hypothetical protein BDY24DRAFT_382273 [Mrakia frigida]|uniref:uncharacterized protein n=1 Tax=Mrakia frigida TaxID=29902 RepID=UPI003FCC0A9B
MFEVGAFPQGDWSIEDEIGLGFATTIGIISLLSIISLLTYLIRHLLKTRHPQASERSHAIRRFLLTDMGAYFTCLLLADLLYSLGYLANLKFLVDYKTSMGGLCTFQGMMFSVGYAGTGWFNSVVSVVTFMILVLRWKIPKWLMPVLVSLGWLFVGFITFLGPVIFAASDYVFPFYGPNNIGCFVLAGGPNYQTWYM